MRTTRDNAMDIILVLIAGLGMACLLGGIFRLLIDVWGG